MRYPPQGFPTLILFGDKVDRSVTNFSFFTGEPMPVMLGQFAKRGKVASKLYGFVNYAGRDLGTRTMTLDGDAERVVFSMPVSLAELPALADIDGFQSPYFTVNATGLKNALTAFRSCKLGSHRELPTSQRAVKFVMPA